MVCDDIFNLKILCLYIIMNNKMQKLHEIVLNVVKNIISDNNNIDLNIKTIYSDFEEGFINEKYKIFKEIWHVRVYFILLKMLD